MDAVDDGYCIGEARESDGETREEKDLETRGKSAESQRKMMSGRYRDRRYEEEKREEM